jgi:hypothetical protein
MRPVVRHVPKWSRCEWISGCRGMREAYAPYCAMHTEIARRNILRGLLAGGGDPRDSLLWRSGDVAWLPEVIRLPARVSSWTQSAAR